MDLVDHATFNLIAAIYKSLSLILGAKTCVEFPTANTSSLPSDDDKSLVFSFGASLLVSTPEALLFLEDVDGEIIVIL